MKDNRQGGRTVNRRSKSLERVIVSCHAPHLLLIAHLGTVSRLPRVSQMILLSCWSSLSCGVNQVISVAMTLASIPQFEKVIGTSTYISLPRRSNRPFAVVSQGGRGVSVKAVKPDHLSSMYTASWPAQPMITSSIHLKKPGSRCRNKIACCLGWRLRNRTGITVKREGSRL